MSGPLDLHGARDAEREASALQRGAEGALREAFVNLAEKERAYRVELSKRITTLHGDGIAWTACADLARGDEKVARLRMERDVAEGVKEAAVQAAWRHAADRRALGRLIEWSARRDVATGLEPEQPADVTFGGRRAA